MRLAVLENRIVQNVSRTAFVAYIACNDGGGCPSKGSLGVPTCAALGMESRSGYSSPASAPKGAGDLSPAFQRRGQN
jgi:hypothetical protein